MRIALLHYTAPPVTGGVESILGAHAALLRGAGHEVRIVAGRGDCELVPEMDSRHPEVEKIAAKLAAGETASESFQELQDSLANRLRVLLPGCDALIAHNIFTMPFNLPLTAALAKLKTPLIAWTHDVAWTNPRYAAYQREGWPWSLLRRALPGTRYVAVSAVRRRELCQVNGLVEETVSVIPNGVDADSFLQTGPRLRELAALSGFADAHPLILVPVRLTPRKRIELALEAVALLRDRHPGLALVVSGPLGPHSPENRGYADRLLALRERLGLDRSAHFLFQLAGQDGQHPVDGTSMASLYRLADCVLLPSESEGFGLPVLEAALARTPIVCADIEVLLETAGVAEALYTFPVAAGPIAVAEAIEQALASPPARLRAHALRAHSWPAVLKQIEAELAAVAGAG